MKVLLVNDVGALVGGAEIVTLSLRDGLRERGHDARIFASSAASRQAPSGADYTCFGTTSRARTLNRVFNPHAALLLRRVLREFRPDVVHLRMFSSQLSPFILPLLREVPTLYHATWHELTCPIGLKVRPDRSLCHEAPGRVCLRSGCVAAQDIGPLMLQMRLIARWRSVFDLVVANSPYLAAHLERAGVSPIEVVWNAVPETRPRAALTTAPTITVAGRLTWEKGIDVLIRALPAILERVPTARLLIAGSGPQAQELAALIDALGVGQHVHLLGQLTAAEMEHRFEGAWVHAVPSVGPESFGRTAAEAMMRGSAVVASRAGGLADIVVHGENGLLVDVDSTVDLGDALSAVLADPLEAERMGRNARDWAMQKMNHERWIDQFLAHYGQIVAVAGRDKPRP